MLIRKPQVIVVAGHPGVGKSTLANSLAEKLGWAVFSTDVIAGSLIQSVQLPLIKAREAAITSVLNQVEQAVVNGNRVIVDVAFNLTLEWERFLELKDRQPLVKYLPLFLQADFDTCEARVLERIALNKNDLRVPYTREAFLSDFESYSVYDFKGLVKMEARRPKEDILKNAVALIYANLMN